MKRRLLLPLLLCSSLFAADPDWKRWEPYALDLLQRYVRIASVNPPADTRKTADLIRGEFEKQGITPKLYQSGPQGQTNLVLRLKGRDSSKKPLLLLNHMDVVPVDAKAWPVDPFAAIIKDGYMWGRGTLDMKGAGVEQMVALMALKQSGITPSRDIVMLCTADEETNGVLGVQWMIANHFDEIDAEYVMDEGGLGSRDLLTPGKLAFGVAVGEKQMQWLKIRATGTAGHGSQPIADNANITLLRALEKAMALPEGGKENPVVAEMRRNLGTLAENKYTGAIQRNTISLTTLRAGVGDPPKANVIPSSAEATLDCRLLPGVNADEFVSDIRARINDPKVTVEALTKADDPGASRSDTPLFNVIRESIRAEYPDATVTPMLIPYGTDSVKLRKKGIIAYGLLPMVLDTATVSTMHSDAERIPVDSFLRGIHIYYRILSSL